jgi:hypothetical protein
MHKACGFIVEALGTKAGKAHGFCTHSTIESSSSCGSVKREHNSSSAFAHIVSKFTHPTKQLNPPYFLFLSTIFTGPTVTTKLIKG